MITEMSINDTAKLESHLSKLQEENKIMRDTHFTMKQSMETISEKNLMLEKHIEVSREEYILLEQNCGQLQLLLNEANTSITGLLSELDASRNECRLLHEKQLVPATTADSDGNTRMKLQLESVLRKIDIAENNISDLQSRLEEANNNGLFLVFLLGSWMAEWESLISMNNQMKTSLEEKSLRITSSESQLESLQKEHNTLAVQHADLAQHVKTELEETSKCHSICQDLVTQTFVTSDTQLQSVMIQQQISEENNLLHRFSFEEQGLSTDDECSVMEFTSFNHNDAELVQLRHEVQSVNKKGQNLVALLNAIKAGSGGGPAIVEIIDDSEDSPNVEQQPQLQQ
jgi:hypothetical protein